MVKPSNSRKKLRDYTKIATLGFQGTIINRDEEGLGGNNRGRKRGKKEEEKEKEGRKE